MGIFTASGLPPSLDSSISDEHVLDFLQATNPCYAKLPTEFREGVRDYLQRQREDGALTDEHLTEYARLANFNRELWDYIDPNSD